MGRNPHLQFMISFGEERKKAMDLGLTTYFTGRPCKRGHLSERRVSTWVCSPEKDGKQTRDPNKASIDKVIPELGYVPGNVFVISWKANKLKSDMTIDQLEKILDYMKRKI